MKKTLLLLLLITVAFSSCKKDDPVIVEYTVSFDSMGGSGLSPVTVPEGSKVTKPGDPVKEGEIFLGWYTDAALTETWQFDTYVVKENVTLYARWSNPGEKVYTVSFNTDGGSEIEVVSVVENEKALQPADPTKTGFEFSGWFTDPERLTAYDFESPVTADITLYGKWTKAELALIDFEAAADFDSKGILWDEATRTLDITDATAGSVLKFNARGVTAVETSVIPFFNKNASSIGGEKFLSNILKVGSLVDGKIAIKVNVPHQTVKVPLDVSVTIQSFDSEGESETITIKSRPNYAGTNIQPVMMKTTDDKLVFWAPINVGAEEIPVEVSSAANTDITKSCGLLFQWGRLFGFAATNDATTTSTEKFDGKTESLGFPKGEGALANMSKWKDKFIICSNSSPNTQGNWLVFDASGADNPADADMVPNVWYQQLWNSGTEASPIKTEYDPCPIGWRVPTLTEWKAIGAGTSIVDSWDATTKLMSISGAESSQKLILPAAGFRNCSSGASSAQGSHGCYWSSSVLSGFTVVSTLSFDSDQLGTYSADRAFGYSVRCVQE